MKTRITFSFKSKNQMPLFLVTKEYYDDGGNIEFAKVLFKIKGRKMRKLEKKLDTYSLSNKEVRHLCEVASTAKFIMKEYDVSNEYAAMYFALEARKLIDKYGYDEETAVVKAIKQV